MIQETDIRLRHIIIMCILILMPTAAHAQFGINDAPSMEAMIGNHKKVRTMLEVRAIAELGAYNLHKDSREAVEDYRSVHNKIDKYKRCFDIIDLILNGTATAFHGIRTYNSCKDNIKGYKKLLDEYAEKVILNDKKPIYGRIWMSDSIIYTNSAEAIEAIKEEAGHLYQSYIDLAAYMSGAMECTTANLMEILNSINASLDKIDATIRDAYLSLWSYMTLRLGYWKKELFCSSRTVKEIAEAALEHWIKSQEAAFQQLTSPVVHTPLGGGGLLGGK